MLQELRKIFESNIKSFEILYILEGVKAVARIMVNEEDKERVFGFFDNQGLSYTLSDFKVVKEDKDKGYSDKGIKVPIESEEKGHFFVYVSKDRKKAERARKLEKENKHKELGLILGYPECCSEFFEKHYEEQSKKHNDYTLAALKDSDGFQFPFYTNIASRHFDLSLLNHFPCRFDCEKSIELGERYLEIIKKEDKEASEIVEGMLKGAIIYTETSGVFLLRYPKLEHNRLNYTGIIGTVNNQLSESLKNAEHIDILAKDRIMLDNLEMKHIGLMLFL